MQNPGFDPNPLWAIVQDRYDLHQSMLRCVVQALGIQLKQLDF